MINNTDSAKEILEKLALLGVSVTGIILPLLVGMREGAAYIGLTVTVFAVYFLARHRKTRGSVTGNRS